MDSLLAPECIQLGVALSSKEQAFHEIARLAQARHKLQASEVVSRLWRRERRQSTALGWGLALPHAHVLGLGRPVAVFLRARDPLPFDAPDGFPVRHILALLVPKPATTVHFDLLTRCRDLCTSQTFRRSLDDFQDVATIWRLW